MARIKQSVWKVLFNAAVASVKQLLRHPKQLRRLLEEALSKMQKYSAAIREISGEFQVIIRLIKAWLAGDYKDTSLKVGRL